MEAAVSNYIYKMFFSKNCSWVVLKRSFPLAVSSFGSVSSFGTYWGSCLRSRKKLRHDYTPVFGTYVHCIKITPKDFDRRMQAYEKYQ